MGGKGEKDSDVGGWLRCEGIVGLGQWLLLERGRCVWVVDVGGAGSCVSCVAVESRDHERLIGATWYWFSRRPGRCR